jgi:hypothetical protein
MQSWLQFLYNMTEKQFLQPIENMHVPNREGLFPNSYSKDHGKNSIRWILPLIFVLTVISFAYLMPSDVKTLVNVNEYCKMST